MAAVQCWYATCAQGGDDLPLAPREREALIGARMLLAPGEAGAALGVLDRGQDEVRAQGRSGSALGIIALQALAHVRRPARAST
jgi:hypothetical protein